MRLATANTKGGTSNTTTALFLSMGLHRLGRTLLVDADPQKSMLSWSEKCTLPFTVISLPVRDIHRRLVDLAADYEHVVIDTPPGDTKIIASAAMAVDTVLVPIAPTGLDIDRVRPTFELLAEVEQYKDIAVGVLLARVRKRTRSLAKAREILGKLGYPLMDTEIPEREMYSQAFGTVPGDLGEYDDLLDELKG